MTSTTPSAKSVMAKSEANVTQYIKSLPNQGRGRGADAYYALARRMADRPPATSLMAKVDGAARIPSDRAASEALRSAGIPGHRYFDGNSRTDGDGTRNYVIYDDAAVQIIDKEFRADPLDALKRTALPTGTALWQKPSEWLSHKLTNAMVSESASILATVPNRPLFAELGKHIPAAQTFLRVKEMMDADRSELEATAAAVVSRWYEAGRKDRAAIDRLHNLMHSSTVTGIDPTGPDEWKHELEREAHEEISKRGKGAKPWAFAVIQEIEDRRKMHASLSADYGTLPKDVQHIYSEARRTHSDMGRAFEKAVIGNIEKATKFALRRASVSTRRRWRASGMMAWRGRKRRPQLPLPTRN